MTNLPRSLTALVVLAALVAACRSIPAVASIEGTERIATCETEIDSNHPLFVAIAATLASMVAEPN